MMVALAVIGLMAAISYPSFSSGLEGVRLRSSVDQAAIFWANARLRADRSQLPVQVTADPKKNELRAVGAESDWRESLTPSEGVRMVEPKELRSYVVYPGMPSPQFEAAFESPGGVRAGLKIDVFTGMPEEWNGE